MLALLLAAPLVLTACGDGNHADSSSASQRVQGDASGRVAKPDSAGGAAAAGGAGSGGAGDSAGAAPGSTGATAAAKLPTRDLIITAGLQVKTTNVTTAAAKAASIAQAAGGYVANESIGSGTPNTPVNPGAAPSDPANGTLPAPATLPDVTGASDSAQALLVLRVPPQKVDSVLADLAGKGTVTYQSRTATDVTGQVADVASRVASAQAAIAELRTLIDRAASMSDLVSLEQALAQRESDLESLEAQQKALADQVQFATITVGYFTQGQPAAPPPVRTGFMRGLTAGWHGFLAVLRGLLVTLGWLLPYAAVAVVLWWPVRRAVRWLRGRRQEREREQSGGGTGGDTGGAAVLVPAGPGPSAGTDPSPGE